MLTEIKNILWISIIVMNIISCSSINKSSIEKYEVASQAEPYDVIIVPGVPYTDTGWSDIMKARVLWSYFLYEKGIAKNIIYSGSAVYTPYVESYIMAMYANSLGIPAQHIYLENKAEHSTENVYYSYKIAKEKGFDKIAIATDPLQSSLLKFFINKKNLHIDYIPVVFPIIDSMKNINPQINAEKAYVNCFVSLPERESFFKRFRGTEGKNIIY